MKIVLTDGQIIILLFLYSTLIGAGFTAAAYSATNSRIDSEYSSSTGQHYRTEKSRQCQDIDVRDLITSEYVQGRSMLPTIDTTTKLLLAKYDPKKEIVEGDIVLVHGKYTHRVTGVYSDFFLTKGDNNPSEDPERNKFEEIDYVVCGVLRV